MILHPFVIASDASHALIGLRRAPTTFDIFFTEGVFAVALCLAGDREERRREPIRWILYLNF